MRASHYVPARRRRRRASAAVIGSTGCGALNFGGTHHKQPTPRRGSQPAVGETIKPALTIVSCAFAVELTNKSADPSIQAAPALFLLPGRPS